MLVETERFGRLEVGDEDVWEAPYGIPGFPTLRRVALLGVGTTPGQRVLTDQQSMFWLQDLDHGSTAFLCIQPWTVFPDYDFEFDAEPLDIADPNTVSVLNLVTVRREAGVVTMTANLRAPVIVDVDQRRMFQIILTDTRWPVNAPFASTAPQEVS